MITGLSPADMETAVKFIEETRKLGIRWIQINDCIRTGDFLRPGGSITVSSCCPLEGRHAQEVGTVVGHIAAARHYGLSDIVRVALVAAADNTKGCIPRLRQLMLGLLPQAA